MAKTLKIGMVCPYGWDTPGGVQIHMKELAEHFIAAGHTVSLIAPVTDEDSPSSLGLSRLEGQYQFHLTVLSQEFYLDQ
jgi:hypothetical protein